MLPASHGNEVSRHSGTTAPCTVAPGQAVSCGRQPLCQAISIHRQPCRQPRRHGHNIRRHAGIPVAHREGATTIILTTVRADTLMYRIDASPTTIASRTRLEIPFTIELDPVQAADSLMRGHIYYISTPLWRRTDGRSCPASATYPCAYWASSPAGRHLPCGCDFLACRHAFRHGHGGDEPGGPTRSPQFRFALLFHQSPRCLSTYHR